MQRAFMERWRVYLVWLGSGISGIRPDELRLTLGPVYALLPLARQVAETLGPWLATLLAARQSRRQVALTAEDEQELAEALEAETRTRPFERGQAQQSAVWLEWLLAAELRRLVLLAEAPEGALRRPGWLPWEVRYWGLAACLARIGQLYSVLAQRQGLEQAQRMFKSSLALVWHQAARAERVA